MNLNTEKYYISFCLWKISEKEKWMTELTITPFIETQIDPISVAVVYD